MRAPFFRDRTTTKKEKKLKCHLDFALIDDIKVVSFVALLDDDFSRVGADREHGVKDIGALVLIQMWKEHVLGDGFS